MAVDLSPEEESALLKQMQSPDAKIQIAALAQLPTDARVSDAVLATLVKMNLQQALETRRKRDPKKTASFVIIDQHFEKVLKNGNPKTTADVCRPYFQDPEMVWIVVGLVKNQSAVVAELIPEFSAALLNSNENVRSLACHALGNVGMKAASTVGQLTNMSQSDPSERAKSAATAALRQISSGTHEQPR